MIHLSGNLFNVAFGSSLRHKSHDAAGSNQVGISGNSNLCARVPNVNRNIKSESKSSANRQSLAKFCFLEEKCQAHNLKVVTSTQEPRRCGQSPSRNFRKLQPLRPGPQCHSAPGAQYRARDTNLVRKPLATQNLTVPSTYSS